MLGVVVVTVAIVILILTALDTCMAVWMRQPLTPRHRLGKALLAAACGAAMLVFAPVLARLVAPVLSAVATAADSW
jgi:hypothetical protein